MCPSLSSSSSSLTSNNPFFFHRTLDFCFPLKPLTVRKARNTKPPSLSSSISHKNSSLELSWISSNKLDLDKYNGWDFAEVDPIPLKKKSFPPFLVTIIGASSTLLGLLAYFFISSKGFKFRLRSPVDALHGYQVPFLVDKKDTESEKLSFDVSIEGAEIPVDNLDGVPEACVAEMNLNTVKERRERMIFPLAADHAQQEAMQALKKLKIIEDDATADELCTRRQYARWLVLANSQLERSRKLQIISSAALSGSRITAFDDVGVEDPDFEHIQSLAESGVIRSKLSEGNTGLSSDDMESKKHIIFSPERFISREDLVSWKAKIEYQVMPGITEEMSRKNIGFLDVKAVSPDVLVELFVDVLADEKSILREVFGSFSLPGFDTACICHVNMCGNRDKRLLGKQEVKIKKIVLS